MCKARPTQPGARAPDRPIAMANRKSAEKVKKIAERGKKRIDDICEAKKYDPEDRLLPEPRRYPLNLKKGASLSDGPIG